MGGALLAIDIGFMGPNYSISTACATSNFCIHAAAKHIRNGEADLMLCGGAESPISSDWRLAGSSPAKRFPSAMTIHKKRLALGTRIAMDL